MPIPCVQNQREDTLGLPWFNVGKTPDGSIEGCKSGPTYSFTLQNCCANCTGKPHDEQSFCIIIISGLQVGDRFNGLINGVYHGCAPEGVETSPSVNRFDRRAVIDLTTNTTTANYVLHRSLKYFQSAHSFRFGYAGIGSATDSGGFGCGYIINSTKFENLRVRARKFVGYEYIKSVVQNPPFSTLTFTNSITRTWSTTHVKFPRWKPTPVTSYDTLTVVGGSMRSTARKFNNGTTKNYGPNQAGCLSSVANGGYGTPTDFPNWSNLGLLPIGVSGTFYWSTQAAILQTATVKYYSETLAAISTATITINKIKRMTNAPTTSDGGDMTIKLTTPKCPGDADYGLACGTTASSATLWYNCSP